MKEKFKSLWLHQFWLEYGGFFEIFASVYFRFACLVVISQIFFIFLNNLNIGNTIDVFNINLTVLPNLLGFSMGAIGIMLGLSAVERITVIFSIERKDSLFVQTLNVFIFSGILQVLSIIMSILSKSAGSGYLSMVFAFFGNFLFIYVLTHILSILDVIYKNADVINRIRSRDEYKVSDNVKK